MEETPFVSVCVQTYQHAPYIAQCLDGILMQQTTFPFEILIGEDESTDGTREICHDYAERYPDRIRLFLRSEKDKIYVHGIKTGRFNFTENLKAARGKYIALLDGDDYWTDSYKLQKQVDILEVHPNDVLCFTNAYNLLPDGSSADYLKKHFRVSIHETITHEDLLYENFIPTAGVMFRNILREFPPAFMNAPVGDWLLYFLLGEHGTFRFLDEIMAVRRVHSGGIISCQTRDVVMGIKIRCYQAIDNITQGEFHRRIQRHVNDHRFGLYIYYKAKKQWKEAYRHLVLYSLAVNPIEMVGRVARTSNILKAALRCIRLIK